MNAAQNLILKGLVYSTWREPEKWKKCWEAAYSRSCPYLKEKLMEQGAWWSKTRAIESAPLMTNEKIVQHKRAYMERAMEKKAAQKNSPLGDGGSKAAELYERRKKLVPNGLGIFNPSSVQYAHDAIIIDAD